MIIESVKLLNFRQFYGEQFIRFSTDPDKNVTLIHAENGVGKTALLNSIKWCLFDDFTSNFNNPKDLLNHQAAEEGSRLVRVEVDFATTDGQRYKANRTDSAFHVYPLINDVMGVSLTTAKQPTGSQEFINTVLPPEMSDYFFFQGEGSSTLKKGKVSTTKQAIQDILGFRPANHAIKDLREISSEYSKEIRKLDNTGQTREVTQRIENCESAISKHNEQIKNYNYNKDKDEDSIAEIESKLQGLDSSQLERLLSDRKQLNANISENKKLKRTIESKKNALIGKYGWSVFGKKVGEKVFDYIDESQLKGRLPEPYNKTLIDDILKEKVCICGNDINEGTEARQRISELLNKAVDPILQARVFNVKAWAQKLCDDHSEAFLAIKNDVKEEQKIDEAQEGFDKEKERIEREFDSFEGDPDSIAETARILNLSLREKNKSLQHSIRESGKASAYLEQAESQLKKYKFELVSLGDNNEAIKKLTAQQAVADKLADEIRDVLKKTETEARSVLLSLVNENIEKFLRNDYTVKLDDSFSVSLVNRYDKIVNLSDGQRLLLNLVFTASLIRHAENRLNAKSGVLLPGTTAPFVIDAPFGELDKTYRGHVASLLPSYSRQVVLFLSSSHWEGEVENNIRSSIGKEYYIKLHESASIGDKKIDVINVMGNDYILNAYDAEKSYSEIVEMEAKC